VRAASVRPVPRPPRTRRCPTLSALARPPSCVRVEPGGSVRPCKPSSSSSVLVVSAPDSPAAAAFLDAAIAWCLSLLLAFLMVCGTICVVVVLSLLESASWACLVAVTARQISDIWFIVAWLSTMLSLPPANTMVAVGMVFVARLARLCVFRERQGAGWSEDRLSAITSMLSRERGGGRRAYQPGAAAGGGEGGCGQCEAGG
jgi:hypothetical protein